MKQVHPEIQSICLLLLQIMEMALYLELCVVQICGIRPVLGRVEDFAKQVELLMRGKTCNPPNFLLSLPTEFHINSMIVSGLLCY